MPDKKHLWIYISALCIALLSLSLFTELLSGKLPLWGGKPWLSMIVGAGLLILSIPFHILGKKAKALYFVSFLMNSVSGGLFLASCYTFMKKKPDILCLAIAAGIVLLLMLVRCFFAGNKTNGHAINKVLLVLNLVCEFILIALWIADGNIFFSVFLFFLVPELMLGLAMLKDKPEDGLPLRWISFASYGYSLLIGIVVLFILSEGDILDGVDIIDFGGGKGKIKKKR